MSLDDKSTQTAAADWIFSEGSVCNFIIKRRPKTYGNKTFIQPKPTTPSPIREHKIFKTKNLRQEQDKKKDDKTLHLSVTLKDNPVKSSLPTNDSQLLNQVSYSSEKTNASSQVDSAELTAKVDQGTSTTKAKPTRPHWSTEPGYPKMPVPLAGNSNPFTPIIKKVNRVADFVSDNTSVTTSGTHLMTGRSKIPGQASESVSPQSDTAAGADADADDPPEEPAEVQDEEQDDAEEEEPQPEASMPKRRGRPRKKKGVGAKKKSKIKKVESDEETTEQTPGRKILPKVLKCKICSRKFSTKKNLKNHSNVHLDKKPFRCDACGAEFTLKLNAGDPHPAPHWLQTVQV
ncbi:early growth response protein 1-A-like [Haliotis rubra]|uniref:early growth response protein 1-A-like n=1 Tax=Haliotis rubra TaxID=36100 RepID=UPI001EE5DC79|nr:early growth response protein 1-A-like [Haliotis rubra]